MSLHAFNQRILAEDLVRVRRPDDRERYAAAQRQARIDPNPHQIDAVIFALRRLREGGCILADEVGLGKTILLVFNDKWIIDTGVQLTNQGGKRRLRLLDAGIQLQRQVAAALMMPHSVRADAPLGRGMPILQANRYAIEHMEVTAAELVGDSEVRLTLGEIILLNVSHHAEQLGLARRIASLDYVWTKKDQLPESIATLVDAHYSLTRSGQPIHQDAERLVEAIQRSVTENAPDLGILYRSGSQDALPDLLASLSEPPPAPPVAVGDVDPDETEIRRRIVKEWKRWAASRGAASARFRQAVREAWNSTCAVCGLHLPSTSSSTSAGVDAAHILPWTDYILDEVSNGICLCKHHHWAFDEGLILIRAESGIYYVEIPDELAQTILAEHNAFGFASLSSFSGPIPEDRLPARREDRPNPRYLDLLRENSI